VKNTGFKLYKMGDYAARRSSNVSDCSVPYDVHVSFHPVSCLLTHSIFDFIPFPSLQSRLPPEVNRILYVRNLPFKISAEELYAIFGKYGGVHQIRLGDKNKDTRGTAFVIYEDIYDAKAAVDHLSGFNVGGRYLVVLYYQPAKFQKRAEAEEKQKELEELRRRVNANKARLAKAEGN
jgi:pre-mRNA branch site protein p14